MNQIEQLALILEHKGPDLFDLISMAVDEKKEYDIQYNKDSNTRCVTIRSQEAYSLVVEDVYIYNHKDELIKQIIKLDGQSKTVFDKFKIAQNIINNMNDDTQKVREFALN